jgi:hypothetical protein
VKFSTWAVCFPASVLFLVSSCICIIICTHWNANRLLCSFLVDYGFLSLILYVLFMFLSQFRFETPTNPLPSPLRPLTDWLVMYINSDINSATATIYPPFPWFKRVNSILVHHSVALFLSGPNGVQTWFSVSRAKQQNVNCAFGLSRPKFCEHRCIFRSFSRSFSSTCERQSLSLRWNVQMKRVSDVENVDVKKYPHKIAVILRCSFALVSHRVLLNDFVSAVCFTKSLQRLKTITWMN